MSKIYEHQGDSDNGKYYYTAPKNSRYRKLNIPVFPVILGVVLFALGFIVAVFSQNEDTDYEQDKAEEAPVVQEETVVSQTDYEWNLILVNGTHPLPDDFQVPEMTELRNNMAIDKRAYPELQKMMDAARAEGLEPLIISSYRTWDKQQELFTNKTQEYLNQGFSQSEAEHMASFWVARPGTSEHHTGLAVDIVDENFRYLDERQESTEVQQWLIKHCAEYGFILRYPTDKSDITGVGYEPWHYRYVGVDAAKAIMQEGICLEEYLERE